MSDLAELRKTYARSELRRSDLHAEPLEQFRAWFAQALSEAGHEPYAVTVATADERGRPSARTVLLRAFDSRGFVFYTNFFSRKGHDLSVNPQASLLFYWPSLERQVRVEGAVERVRNEEADAYFARRPRESQLAAHASTPQSAPIAHRAALELRYQELAGRFPGEVPRPEDWGGFRVIPDTYEFWQGRPGRLHDRFLYTREGAIWHTSRLMP
ncbi:pyridoxamine 5'-phosphate oxidase [Deinococcus peraridilitoris]|uniref:Pyridoxine/pyridoxamine 5'-phosphate oxidase n=1 Tax=Deinococcus peraridilitoris (strain DSM 19664 / LMG 22246 / CIP 109416 / KR-200) TaxID=937777 RepID=K9ZXA4_DEIPD|nr:pyridoxamine 5'-phosphate oxidase [Deinococcus peraridilitoris]AFZ65829.1 pyridoxamine-phosphate oxidase [Deinococcus peraridilitoris DSM 19664]